MKKLIYNNRLFIILFSILWSTIFIIRFFFDKGELIIKLGSYHNDFLISFFSFVTMLAEEIVYGLFAIAFLFIRFRNSITIVLTGIIVTIFGYILKSIFRFERPMLYFQNRGMEDVYQRIEGVEPYMGLTSFPSGHTMAGFALMFLLSIYIKSRWNELLLLFIACLIATSRIYLGHHFLEDVLFGSILGIVVAAAVYLLMEYWKAPALENSILTKKKFKA